MVVQIKHHTDAHASGVRNQVIQDEKLCGCAVTYREPKLRSCSVS